MLKCRTLPPRLKAVAGYMHDEDNADIYKTADHSDKLPDIIKVFMKRKRTFGFFSEIESP